MKKFFFIFLLIDSSFAAAETLHCKAHLLIEESEDVQATDRVKIELHQGQASLSRELQSKDQKIRYAYQVQAEKGRIISLGIQSGETKSDTRAFTRYLTGQDQVLMNASSGKDQSLLIVSCRISI